MKKKKLLFSSTLLAITATIVTYRVSHTYPDKELSETALLNIEALADEESSKCDNFNGYRRITSGNERIYDCCYKEQIGKGKDDCKRW